MSKFKVLKVSVSMSKKHNKKKYSSDYASDLIEFFKINQCFGIVQMWSTEIQNHVFGKTGQFARIYIFFLFFFKLKWV